MIMEDVDMRATFSGRGRRTLRSPSDCWRIKPGAFAAAAPWAGHSASDAVKSPKGASNEAKATNERRMIRRIEPPFQTRTGTLSEAREDYSQPTITNATRLCLFCARL